MSYALLTFALYVQSALLGQDHKSPLPTPAVANTVMVSDYRVFGEIKRTLTETPVEAEVARWRQGFLDLTPAQRKAAYGGLPGFETMQLRGIDDGANTPSLRLTFKTMLALDDPILTFSYQPQFRQRIEVLIGRLAELPAKDNLITLPEWRPTWSEELYLPPDFILASPLAEMTKEFGFVQLRRTLKRHAGRLTLQLQCTLTQASATVDERAATLAALKELPADAPLLLEARLLGSLVTEAVVPAMNELRAEVSDPASRVWATIQRAAAFRELFLPKLGIAVLDAALAKSPKDASLLRARVMLGLALRPSLIQSRQQLIPYLDRLLAQPPADAARLRLELAKLLCEPNFSESPPSAEELKRAAELYRGLPPSHWGREYALLLLKLGDYETLQKLLAKAKVELSESDRRMLTLCGLAGRHQTEPLIKVMAKLEPDQARAALDQAYKLLAAHGQIEALRVLAEHGRDHFEPKRLTDIELAVRESRILPSSQSPEGIFRQWLRAISSKDRDALQRLILPESLALDRTYFENLIETAIGEPGPKWPFGVGELEVLGNPNTGYLLKLDHSHYFFAGNQDGYRFVTFNKTVHPAGRYILKLIERGQLESAYQWLDWFYKEVRNPINRLVSGEEFWGDAVPRSEETAVFAAKVLALTGPGREQVRGDIIAAFEEANDQRRDALAILFIFTETEMDDFLKEADFSPSQPGSNRTLILENWMCTLHGQCEGLQEACAAGSACALRVIGIQGGYPALFAEIQRQDREGSLERNGLESLVHFALLEREVPEIPAVYLPEGRSDAIMAYYAEHGMIEEVLLALSQRPDRPDLTTEAYLLGRMAEAFGEPQLARTFYAEIKSPIMPEVGGLSHLAKKHLARLGAP